MIKIIACFLKIENAIERGISHAQHHKKMKMWDRMQQKRRQRCSKES